MCILDFQFVTFASSSYSLLSTNISLPLFLHPPSLPLCLSLSLFDDGGISILWGL